MNRTSCVLLMLALAGMTAAVVGCAGSPKPRTTAVTSADIQLSSTELVQKLADSPFLSARKPDSPPLAVCPGAITNRSNERLSRVDQCGVVARILGDPGVRALFEQKNIRVVDPPEDGALYAGLGFTPSPGAAVARPSHVLQASFGSMTRAAAGTAQKVSNERMDYFSVQLEIVDVATREKVWSGYSEFARVAYGDLID